MKNLTEPASIIHQSQPEDRLVLVTPSVIVSPAQRHHKQLRHPGNRVGLFAICRVAAK